MLLSSHIAKDTVTVRRFDLVGLCQSQNLVTCFVTDEDLRGHMCVDKYHNEVELRGRNGSL